MHHTAQAINGIAAILLAIAGLVTLHWAWTRQSHHGRVQGKLRRRRHGPAVLALIVLFGLWKAIETGAIDIADILTGK